jgi:mono/diheme cytochrome c family protein
MSNVHVVFGTIALMLFAVAKSTAQAVDSSSVAIVGQGKAIYEGKTGGALCFTCHGPQGKGIPGLGPDLTDGQWLHGDGGFAFLQKVIQTGVSKPKQSMAVMPPMGGGKLTDAQLAALAAYVKALE